MQPNIVLIDFNNVFYRVLHAYKHLSHGTKNTGGIYGVLQTLSQCVNLYSPVYIAFFNDKYPLKRQELYPEYKAKRHNKPKDQEFSKYIAENRTYVTELLNLLGIPLIEVEGYEADDLIAANVDYNFSTYSSIIVANDDDLYSYLDKEVLFHRGKDTYNYTSFKADYPDLEPCDWVEFKTLTGNHNEVTPLFRGCGPKTALKILKEEDSNIFSEYRDKYKLNKKLVTYPFDLQLLYSDVHIPMKSFSSRRKLENILMREYGITLTSAIESALDYLENLND